MFNVKLAEETLQLHAELAELSHTNPEEFSDLLAKYDNMNFAARRVVAAMCGVTETMWREQAHRDAQNAYERGLKIGRDQERKFQEYKREHSWLRHPWRNLWRYMTTPG